MGGPPPAYHISDELVDWLFIEMKRQGYNLSSLAYSAGCSHAMLSHWKGHRYAPTLIGFIKVAKALGYEIIPVRLDARRQTLGLPENRR